MQVQTMALLGDQLVLTVAALHPSEASHLVYVPLAALPDRKAVYAVPPCAEGHETCVCAQCACCLTTLDWILTEHLIRLQPAQAATLPKARQAVIGRAEALARAKADTASPPAPTPLTRTPTLDWLKA